MARDEKKYSGLEARSRFEAALRGARLAVPKSYSETLGKPKRKRGKSPKRKKKPGK